MVKLVEIYQKAAEYDSALKTNRTSYGLREVFINPDYIVYITEDENLSNISENNSVLGLHEGTEYTKLALMHPRSAYKNISVVGNVEFVADVCGGIR